MIDSIDKKKIVAITDHFPTFNSLVAAMENRDFDSRVGILKDIPLQRAGVNRLVVGNASARRVAKVFYSSETTISGTPQSSPNLDLETSGIPESHLSNLHGTPETPEIGWESPRKKTARKSPSKTLRKSPTNPPKKRDKTSRELAGEAALRRLASNNARDHSNEDVNINEINGKDDNDNTKDKDKDKYKDKDKDEVEDEDNGKDKDKDEDKDEDEDEDEDNGKNKNKNNNKNNNNNNNNNNDNENEGVDNGKDKNKNKNNNNNDNENEGVDVASALATIKHMGYTDAEVTLAMRCTKNNIAAAIDWLIINDPDSALGTSGGENSASVDGNSEVDLTQSGPSQTPPSPTKANSRSNKVTYTRKRKWSEEEEYAVRQGVARFGRKWQTIKESYPVLSSRTGVNIKDKWSTICKQEERKNGQGRAMAQTPPRRQQQQQHQQRSSSPQKKKAANDVIDMLSDSD